MHHRVSLEDAKRAARSRPGSGPSAPSNAGRSHVRLIDHYLKIYWVVKGTVIFAECLLAMAMVFDAIHLRLPNIIVAVAFCFIGLLLIADQIVWYFLNKGKLTYDSD